MSNHGRNGCTDWNGNAVVPYSCMEDSCFPCRVMLPEHATNYDRPCPNSPAGKMIARSAKAPPPAPQPALCQCVACLKYLARDREEGGGLQRCIECVTYHGAINAAEREWGGIPLAELRGPLKDALSIELLGLLTEECGEVSQRGRPTTAARRSSTSSRSSSATCSRRSSC